MFVLFLHVAFFRDPFILIPLLVVNLWNMWIETVEMRNLKCVYFLDLWNYADILRFLLGFVYFGVALSPYTSQTLRTILLTFLCVFQSAKGFQMFSFFKATRVLTRIIIEIIKDMIPFLIFILLTTFSVSQIYTAATPDDSLTDWTYVEYMMHVYRLDFGDFSLDDYSPLDTGIFIFAVIIVPLILLNMLIAIMGDTFDRVK